ncbi:phytanoyl-CoA dioxygenase [bacterium]|jgi:ectoine hydroxylase-related dioxygenase (phytanoyl-CoA dioxygenase family)|nr:phytanoyl-CoA dioxygenase family protein [Pirellulales bacterium]NBP79515.1 phytanoyl-CoA dioxygenase [bacterium]
MSASDASLDAALGEPYELTAAQREQFREEGFIHLPHVLSPDALVALEPAITADTIAHDAHAGVPLEDRDTYGRAFIQVGNLWERSPQARRLTFSLRLARIASELLDTRGVRLWHDQSLYKEPSGGFTPWHADQQYWPMASGLCVTAWIPLQAVPLEMGPLAFARGSHRKRIGRDLAISDESEALIRTAVAEHGLREVTEPYAAGDVSFHLGWTLHRAGPNTTPTPRKVHTVIYMDVDMRLAKPKNAAQQLDQTTWTPSTAIGEVMNDPRNPVLYERA